MAKYEAIDKCYGFQDRYYEKGDKIEVNTTEIKNMTSDMLKYFKKHFKKAGAVAAEKEAAE
jgi:hypothetical protein